jgi:hypothetical protein
MHVDAENRKLLLGDNALSMARPQHLHRHTLPPLHKAVPLLYTAVYTYILPLGQIATLERANRGGQLVGDAAQRQRRVPHSHVALRPKTS